MTVSGRKRPKRSHGCGVGASHLDQESAFDLIFGLGVLNESQASVHRHLGNSSARQSRSLD
jgi:hypothetical protein